MACYRAASIMSACLSQLGIYPFVLKIIPCAVWIFVNFKQGFLRWFLKCSFLVRGLFIVVNDVHDRDSLSLLKLAHEEHFKDVYLCLVKKQMIPAITPLAVWHALLFIVTNHSTCLSWHKAMGTYFILYKYYILKLKSLWCSPQTHNLLMYAKHLLHIALCA